MDAMPRFSLDDLSLYGQPELMRLLGGAVREKSKITYLDVAMHFRKSLAGEFKRVSPRNVGRVAGDLMNRISEVAPQAPPINALNGQTKLPGHGSDWFVQRYLRDTSYEKLSRRAKREMLQPVFDDVYAFPRWEDVARRAYAIKIAPAKSSGRAGENDGKGRRLGLGGPAESPEHLRLKEFVQRHPRKFGAPRRCRKGIVEKRLESLDEIDVWFAAPGRQLAVEVKSTRSLDDDLRRGIFQCVKYRAVLLAQAKWEFKRMLPTVRAKLVSERALPPEPRKLASALDIDIHIIKPLTSKAG
jgi:hypothetical protein